MFVLLNIYELNKISIKISTLHLRAKKLHLCANFYYICTYMSLQVKYICFIHLNSVPLLFAILKLKGLFL